MAELPLLRMRLEYFSEMFVEYQHMKRIFSVHHSIPVPSFISAALYRVRIHKFYG